MRLESSIVILKGKDCTSQDIDLVVMVKHPQGIDPVERIYTAIGNFLSSPQGQECLRQHNEYSWSDLLAWMSPADWSNYELYVESALSWAVAEPVESLNIRQESFAY
jgi:hypothetical protein